MSEKLVEQMEEELMKPWEKYRDLQARKYHQSYTKETYGHGAQIGFNAGFNAATEYWTKGAPEGSVFICSDTSLTFVKLNGKWELSRVQTRKATQEEG